METASHDVAVIGGTPGGIAAAVRAARDGHDAVLVTYNAHLGGMMAGGLSYTDTLTNKRRAPLLEEFVETVREHYRETYGADSEQYEHCEDGYVFEPHVAERAFEDLVEEPSLTVRRGYHPVSVDRANERLRAVRLRPFESGTLDGVWMDAPDGAAGEGLRVEADVFVEATYEGDLLAAAGVPYRTGRESRAAYDEQFAGEIYTGIRGDRFYPREAVGPGDDSAPMDRRGPLDVPSDRRQGPLDLIPHPAGLTEIYPHSSGAGDDAVQAYNYRLCLSRDPDNRRLPGKPDGYDRTAFLADLEAVERDGLRPHLLLRYLPNEKADMNAADLPGENHDYPEADWERRVEIARRHREHAVGLLYFLQNDEAVPEDVREAAREWGLPEDEFADTGNLPWQLYVREARRLHGRYTFREGDARHAPGLDRAPVHRDAVAVAEYPLDSHACRERSQTGSQEDGFFYASQVTRPAQVPYRALLPRGVDNLLVPVPLSATHVAYGTVRLEPTWMHLGESAGVAASLALRSAVPPAEVDVAALKRRLVEAGVMVSFFNEFDAGSDAPWAPAVQFLGTLGFFAAYDARPEDPLREPVADHWVRRTAELLGDGDPADPTDAAAALPDPGEGDVVPGDQFRERLRAAGIEDLPPVDPVDGADPVTRGDACVLLYELLTQG